MPLFQRQDGTLSEGLPSYRRLLPLLSPTRTESAVYLEQRLDVTRSLERIDQWNRRNPDDRLTFFHLFVHELVQVLDERPRLNRFVSGGRHYDRDGIHVSFCAKRARTDDAPIVDVKERLEPGRSLAETSRQLRESVTRARQPRPSRLDRLVRLPALLLRLLLWAARKLDAWNLLPHSLTQDDPLFASVFVSHLGGLDLDAAYHHNFEYGNVPLFVTIGRVRDELYARADGKVGVKKELTLKWTFDERIEDGLYCATSLDLLRRRLEAPAMRRLHVVEARYPLPGTGEGRTSLPAAS